MSSRAVNGRGAGRERVHRTCLPAGYHDRAGQETVLLPGRKMNGGPAGFPEESRCTARRTRRKHPRLEEEVSLRRQAPWPDNRHSEALFRHGPKATDLLDRLEEKQGNE